MAPTVPAARETQPIPSVTSPVFWEFALQRHDAKRAGAHFDFRLADPMGHAHSWAFREMPRPGQNILAVQQPTHTRKYMDFAGKIPSGYGAGDVKLVRRERAEIITASADKIRFNLYPGREVEEYVIRRTDGANWLLQNLTRTRASGMGSRLPDGKPKYRETKITKVNPSDQGTTLQAKLDGAHVLFDFQGTEPRVFSYRTSKRSPTGLIHHTPKVDSVFGQRTPSALQGSVLRGELVALDANGKAIPAARVGGMLNAGVMKSRELQSREGNVVPYAFDVVKWKNKDVSNLPFSEKAKLLDQAHMHAPWLLRPRSASTPAEKRILLQDVQSGREPSTEEGVIEWRSDQSTPRKAKVQRERDVWVRKVFSETGERKGLAGGFEFSLTPNGPVAGRVGSGMSHELKRDLLKNPSRYVGLHAKILTTPAAGHYAPRSPVFAGWHMEQDMPDNYKVATTKLAAMTPRVDKVIRDLRASGKSNVAEKIKLLASGGGPGYEGALQSIMNAMRVSKPDPRMAAAMKDAVSDQPHVRMLMNMAVEQTPGGRSRMFGIAERAAELTASSSPIVERGRLAKTVGSMADEGGPISVVRTPSFLSRIGRKTKRPYLENTRTGERTLFSGPSRIRPEAAEAVAAEVPSSVGARLRRLTQDWSTGKKVGVGVAGAALLAGIAAAAYHGMKPESDRMGHMRGIEERKRREKELAA